MHGKHTFPDTAAMRAAAATWGKPLEFRSLAAEPVRPWPPMLQEWAVR
jgi:hypothetical protein